MHYTAKARAETINGPKSKVRFSPLIHNMTGPLFSSFQDIKQVVMHHAAQTAPPPSQHTDPQSSSTAAAAHYK